MQIDEYEKDRRVNTSNTNLKPGFEKRNENIIFPTTNGIINTNELNKNTLKYKIKKFLKNFFKAYLFKSFFKICRSLDKSWNHSLSFDQTVGALLNFSNVQYGIFVTGIKLLFKIFRILLKLTDLENYIDHKRINLLLGVIANIILFPYGRESNVTFITCIYYLLRHLMSFYNSYSRVNEKRVYKESKNLYFIGFTLGFIITSLMLKKCRDSIKLIKNFL